MGQASAVQATIKGDVSGQVAVGNYILQMGDVNGGIVNFAPPSDRPAYSMRPSPINLRPRAFPSLLDRDGEFASVKTALQNSTPVSIYGEEGIGKTSFVRQVAHLPEIVGVPDGVVYLDAQGRGLDDLLQSLFDVFCESIPEFKPRNAEIYIALQGLEALIFLDNLNLQRDEVISLLGAVPSFTFVLSSVERSLWGEGQIISLRGLPEKDALTLFERELGRSMNEEEQAAARKICALLQGHPLRILQATSLAHEKSRPIGEILEELQGDVPEKAVLQASLSTLTGYQKSDLAILAAAGGATIPLEHLVSLSQDQNARKTLRELISLGLVQAHSPRYSLTGNLASSLPTLWDLSSWEDTLLDYFVSWLEGQPAQALIEESADALIYTVKKAGEKEQWLEIIRLGRAFERGLILWKRWQAWADILNLILKAARALSDRKVEAWALHQLGSRAMCLGKPDQARELLTEALNIRKTIRDYAGERITQHNLNVLLRASVPPKGGNSGGRPWFIGGSAIIIALLMSAIAVFVVLSEEALYRPILTAIPIPIPFISIPPDTPTPVETFTPTQSSPIPTTPTVSIPNTGETNGPTSTNTPTVTSTISPEPSITPTPSITETPDVYGPPAPIIVSPQNGSVLDCAYKTVTLAWNPVNDPSGINGYQVELYISYGRSPAELADQRNFTSSQTSWNIIIECDGSYGWKIMAQDGAGNWGAVSSGEFSTISRSVAPITPTPTFTPVPPDTTPPKITNIFVSDQKVNYPYPCGLSTTLTVSATVVDESGINAVTLYYYYDGAKVWVPMTQISRSDYQVSINVGAEADRYLSGKDGTISIMIEAVDGAGISGSSDYYRDAVFVYYCPG